MNCNVVVTCYFGFLENLQAKEIEELPLKNLVFINDPFDVVSPVRFTSRETGVQGPFILTGDINGIRFDDVCSWTILS